MGGGLVEVARLRAAPATSSTGIIAASTQKKFASERLPRVVVVAVIAAGRRRFSHPLSGQWDAVVGCVAAVSISRLSRCCEWWKWSRPFLETSGRGNVVVRRRRAVASSSAALLLARPGRQDGKTTTRRGHQDSDRIYRAGLHWCVKVRMMALSAMNATASTIRTRSGAEAIGRWRPWAQMNGRFTTSKARRTGPVPLLVGSWYAIGSVDDRHIFVGEVNRAGFILRQVPVNVDVLQLWLAVLSRRPDLLKPIRRD